MPSSTAPGSFRAGIGYCSLPSLCALVVTVSGCTEIGPTAQVLPGPAKTLEQFAADQQVCTAYTDAQIRPAANRSSERQLGTFAVGTVLGAGLGGAIGGGNGAGIGAAAGAIGGTAVGVGQGETDVQRLQIMYDNDYTACMVTRGDRLPVPVVPQTVVVAPPAVVVQPAPYYIQPAPVVVQPAPYVAQPTPVPSASSPPWSGQ